MTPLAQLRRTSRRLLPVLPLLAALAVPVDAQLLPDQVDEATVGDWQCGGLRLYLTRLGSIEVLGDGYRAGRYETADGAMTIAWDEGGQETWAYAADAGALTVTTADGTAMSCVPRG